MASCSRRHLLAASLAWGTTGCHLVRFTNMESDKTPSVGDALKAAKPDGHPLDGPRRVGMKIATIAAPLRDKAIDQAIWHTTDEQIFSEELRNSLKNNGLRIGLLRSSLPAEIEELMQHGGFAGQKVEPLVVNQPVSEPTKIATTEKTSETSLLIDTGSKVQGKTYRDVTGYLRITASIDDQKGVVLKTTPELHHGEMKAKFANAGNVENAFEPAQMTLKTMQEEEVFKDLAANVRVEPGQCLVIGLDPSRESGLGWFLLTKPPETDKETQQKLILVWAWNSGREAVLDIPTIVQSNSRQTKTFQPLESPPPAIVVKRDQNRQKTKDDQLQPAGFDKPKPAPKADPKPTPDSKPGPS